MAYQARRRETHTGRSQSTSPGGSNPSPTCSVDRSSTDPAWAALRGAPASRPGWRHLQPGRGSAMAASSPLPAAQDLPTLRAKLQGLLRFLRQALSIANAHTVDFYTESVWAQLVDVPPETVLEVLRATTAEDRTSEARPPAEAEGGAGITGFSKIFCETSQKLVSVEAFALAAKYYSIQNLGICTPFEQLLVALRGNKEEKTGDNVKPDEFMNLKKSHEVQAMSELISSVADYCGIKQDCLMVGLHTCGDLAPNTLRIFTSNSEIKGVCSVGCCYHLLSEEFENPHKECTQEKWGFPMCHYLKEERWSCGRNARMSACLALERVAVGQGLPTESLFYRAVLQDIIKDCYGITKCDRYVGKIYSKSSSFLDYVRKSLKKLGLDESKLPEKMIMDYYEKYKTRMNELEAFNMLKVVLAPCIETLILLDRLCYLKEQEDIAWSALVKLFDPVKSPRCYAVIALKQQQ
ncbi:probable methyltransferase-like protein 25 isoform X4 [Myotis daubentonii]|uniref:probable methyltransferase-like protein 25 isoform X4 n=1 Tax=Myotis daubentonii TaxID=98922 RepID=UPI0028730095|nr:probable methyltransferase-like protein 25 isoform X4 [Myotis daubentonii]